MSTSEIEMKEAMAQSIHVNDDALVVDLVDGRTVTVPLAWFPRLAHGTSHERANWRLIGRGEGIHWPDLDEDISVASLLAGRRSRETQESLRRWLDGRMGQGPRKSGAGLSAGAAVAEGTTINITEDLNIKEKVASFGFALPGGLALLPGNLLSARGMDDLLYEASSATVKKLLRQGGLEVTGLENDTDHLAQSFKKSFEWLGPTLFFGSALMMENSAAVTVALNIIANYLTDMFRGLPYGHAVKLTIIVERERAGTRSYKRIEYSGSAEGLRDLGKVIEKGVGDD